MQSDALTHQKGTITDANPVVLPLVLGDQYLLICGLAGDDFNSQTLTPELFTGVNGGAAAQGTLTVDEQVTVGDTFTIGTKTFTITTAGDTGEGKVPIGATEAASKAAIVAAINGTDGSNSPIEVTAAAFAADDCVLTARAAGTAGNAIATTETFAAAGTIFDAGTLGTTTAGTDDYDDETAELPTPGSADSDGSPQAFAAHGMVYFDAGLPNLILQPSGALTSVRYFLTKVGTMRGLLAQ
jgi:hypothetical protein